MSKKFKHGLFAILLFVTFVQPASSYSNEQDSDSNDHNYATYIVGGSVVAGILLAITAFNSSNHESSPSPTPPAPVPPTPPVPPIPPEETGNPVILSSSNYNLLTFADLESGNSGILGKIKILNNGEEPAEDGFTIDASYGSNIEILDSSTCLNRVEPNSQCYFDTKYKGIATDKFLSDKIDRKNSTIIINQGKTNSDSITIHTLTNKYEQLFDPTIDSVNAHGIDTTKKIFDFVTLAKNGLDFIYAATEDGVFKTSDQGKTWLAINYNLTNKEVHTLCAIDSNLYAGTWGNGVFKTLNNGTKWDPLTTNGLSNKYIHSLCTLENYLYAGTKTGVFRIDLANPIAWEQVDFVNDQTDVYALYVFKNKLYAGIWYTNSDKNGVYELNNGSIPAWEKIGTTLSVYSLSSNDGYLYAGVNGSNGVHKFDGITWQVVGSINIPANVHTLKFANDLLYAGTDNGVYKLDPILDNVWKNISNGFRLQNPTVLSLHFNSNNLFSGLESGGIYKTSTTDTESWSLVSNTLTEKNTQTLFKTDSDEIYVGTYGDGVFKSVDGGANWLPITTSGLDNKKINAIWILDNQLYVAVDNDSNTTDATYRINLGSANSTWKNISSGLGGSDCTNHPEYCTLSGKSFSAFDGNIYLGIYNKVVSGPGGGAYQFTSNNSWERKGILEDKYTGKTNALAVIGDAIYASWYDDGSSSNKGVYRTTTPTIDAWSLLAQNSLSNKNVLTLYANSNNLLAGTTSNTNGNIFKIDTTSSIPTWNKISQTATEDKSANAFCLHQNKIYGGFSDGSNNGVYVYDQQLWNQLNSEVTDSSTFALESINNSLYAATNKGVLKLISKENQ